VCPHCGVATGVGVPFAGPYDPQARSWIVALLLSVFLGSLGVDRFYLGKIGTGILKLITLGGLGIWWLIDVILIATGTMRDANGRLLNRVNL
jgi:TM2 domain-containing membrane protein YozV